jgi:hypothetical protein
MAHSSLPTRYGSGVDRNKAQAAFSVPSMCVTLAYELRSPEVVRLQIAIKFLTSLHFQNSLHLCAYTRFYPHAAYVLDLQAAFNDRRPAADASLGSQPHAVEENPQLTSSAPTGDGNHDRSTWRAHALHLESEAVWLRAQLDAERVSKCCELLFAFFPRPLTVPWSAPLIILCPSCANFLSYSISTRRLVLALNCFPVIDRPRA